MYVSTFVILSPADYQSILAELQSPAALRSEPNFLEPELPVTPNISSAHHQHHVYPDPTTPAPSTPHPHPLPFCPTPEIECASGAPDNSAPRSPPRPCELTLQAPVFELPEATAVAKVRKPHIALNDQLLLSEEEDRSYQEMAPCRKARSPSLPTMCELDVPMAYSTSSPSLSSVSSITPSSPEGRLAQIESPNAFQDAGFVEGRQDLAKDPEKVKEVDAAGLAQGNGLVDWVEQDLIKNVERKCELITKDGRKLDEGSGTFLEQMRLPKQNDDKQLVLSQNGTDAAGGEVQVVRDCQGRSGEQCAVGMEEGKMMAETESSRGGHDESSKFQTLQEDSGDGNPESNKVDTEIPSKDEEKSLSGSHGDTCGTPEEGKEAEKLSPQAWVEALRKCNDTDSQSDEEEEEEEDKKVREEPLKSLMEEEQAQAGSEEEKDDGEKAQAVVEEMRVQAEQTEKDVCSLVGWHSDSSSVNVEPPTPGRSVSSDLLDRRER